MSDQCPAKKPEAAPALVAVGLPDPGPSSVQLPPQAQSQPQQQPPQAAYYYVIGPSAPTQGYQLAATNYGPPPAPTTPYVVGYTIGYPGQVVYQPQPVIQAAPYQQTAEPTHRFTFPHEPVEFDCPNPKCKYHGTDMVHYEMVACTYMIMVGMCFVAPVLFCVPPCVPWCKDAVHTCPKCNILLGRSKACS